MAKKTKPEVMISNVTITNEALQMNAGMADAIRAVAEAARENAIALQKLAERLAGPEDNRIGIRIDSP